MNLFSLSWWLMSGSAMAGPIDVGLGLIENPTPYFNTFGLRAFGRYSMDSLSFEGGLIVRPDRGTEGLNGLTHTLVAIANEGSGQVGFQQPANLETLAGTAVVHWQPAEVRNPEGLSGGPVLIGGIQMGIVQEYYARYDSSVSSGPPTELVAVGSQVQMGPILGIGFKFISKERFGLTLGTMNRSYYMSKPQYDPDELTEDKELAGKWGIFADFTMRIGDRP